MDNKVSQLLDTYDVIGKCVSFVILLIPVCFKLPSIFKHETGSLQAIEETIMLTLTAITIWIITKDNLVNVYFMFNMTGNHD